MAQARDTSGADVVVVARSAYQAGLSVLPADVSTKRPARMVGAWKRYEQEQPAAEDWKAWRSQTLAIGVVCGAAGVESLDFDLSGVAWDDWAARVPADLLSRLYIERSPSGGRHVVYIVSDPQPNTKLTTWWFPADELGESYQRRGAAVVRMRVLEEEGVRLAAFGDKDQWYRCVERGGSWWAPACPIETRGRGGWLVVAPSAGYVAEQGDLGQLPRLTWPERQQLVEAALGLADDEPGNRSAAPGQPAGGRSGPDHERPGDRYSREGDHRELLERHGWSYSGEHQGQGGKPNELWTRPGKSRSEGHSATWDLDLRVFYCWTSSAAPLREGQGYSLFQLLTTLEHQGDPSAAARALAAIYRPPPAQRTAHTATRGNATGGNGDLPAEPDTWRYNDDDWPELNESGNARRFLRRCGADVRYCHTWRTWLIWQGTHWQEDETGQITERMRQAIVDDCQAQLEAIGDSGSDLEIREMLKALPKNDPARPALLRELKLSRAKKEVTAWVKKNQNRRPLENSLALAATLRALAVTADDLDADAMLFSCKNGTLDLRDGVLIPHEREHLITRYCPVDYVSNAHDPALPGGRVWHDFLEQLTGGDAEIQAFLQALGGMSMTADTSEELVPILVGPGGTGKSTFIGALSGIMGDYASAIPFETLLANNGQRKWTLAKICKARLVSCEEAPENQRFASEVLKAITGGTPIEAERKYADPFTYVPRFKLWLVTNQLPRASDQDSGLWRRLVVIRCDHIPTNPNRQLKSMLRSDSGVREAILSWMVQGASCWYERGLTIPDQVRASTNAYREDQDPIQAWLDEETIWGRESYLVSRRDAWNSYTEWANQNNSGRAIGQRAFCERLRSRGAWEAWSGDPDRPRGRQRAWGGFRLRWEDEEPRPAPHAGEGAGKAAHTSDSLCVRTGDIGSESAPNATPTQSHTVEESNTAEQNLFDSATPPASDAHTSEPMRTHAHTSDGPMCAHANPPESGTYTDCAHIAHIGVARAHVRELSPDSVSFKGEKGDMCACVRSPPANDPQPDQDPPNAQEDPTSDDHEAHGPHPQPKPAPGQPPGP